MTINQKPTGTAKSLPIGLLYGLVLETGITVLCSTVLAALISAGHIEWAASGYGIMIMLLLCSFLGAWFSCSMVRRRILLVCVLSGAIYVGTMLGVAALLFKADLISSGVTLLLVACGSTAAAMVYSAEFKKTEIRMKKRRFKKQRPEG